MFHVTGGICQFCVDGVTHALTPGQSLLVPPDVRHEYSNPSDQLLTYQEIKFTVSKPSLQTMLTENCVIAISDPLTSALFRQIVSEYEVLGSQADDAAAAYLVALLNTITRDHRHQTPRQFQYIDASQCSPLSQQVIHYLEAHYGEDLSLDTLAQALGYNKTYLCGAFKRNTKLTILDCLNTIRIRRAAELIVYSDHSLPQVAGICGFASVSHFTRVFLKYVGVTPGQCRRSSPLEVVFEPPQTANTPRPSIFIYSVLAQKQITVQMILDFNESEKKGRVAKCAES